MIQKRIEVLLKEIALKYNKPIYVIEEIFMSQFRLTREQIRSLEFNTIKLPNWGKYVASNKKVIKFKKSLLKYNDKYGQPRDNKNTSL